VRLSLPGVALVALAAVISGCGSQPSATRLKIEVADRSGVHAYRLQCDPAEGSAPGPAAICAELLREPKLLVGGPGLPLSCPSSDANEVFRISGRYRGQDVDATSTTGCGWVPGQDDAAGEWSYLMDDRGHGVAEHDLGSAQVTAAQRKRNRQNAARLQRLSRLERAATRARLEAIAAGRMKVSSRTAPDRPALTILRNRVTSVGRPSFPEAFDARVYSTTRRRAEAALGSGRDFTRPDGPVYVLLVHYAYRDYRGGRHRDDQPWWSLLDARTLQTEAFGGGGENLHPLGRPLALAF
jgi:hypothetical protein